MSTAEFTLRDDIAAICGPILVSDNRESWLRRGARRVGISYRQAKSLFYGEVSEDAAVKVARAAAKAREKELRDARYRADHAEVLERLAALEELVERRASGRASRPGDAQSQVMDVVGRVLGRDA